jgi:hypothetical protein
MVAKKGKALPGDGFGMMRMGSRHWKKKIVCQTVDTSRRKDFSSVG